MPHTTLSGGFLALCRLIERKVMSRPSFITVFSGIALFTTCAMADSPPILLHPLRVFDGVSPKAHEGWVVSFAAIESRRRDPRGRKGPRRCPRDRIARNHATARAH